MSTAMNTTLRASAGHATKGVFGLVGTLADNASKVVMAAGKSADMLDRFVAKHHRAQVYQDAQETGEFVQNLLEQSKLRRAQAQDAVDKVLASNPQLTALYEANDAAVKAALLRAAAELGEDIDFVDRPVPVAKSAPIGTGGPRFTPPAVK